jgi:S-methylmethionine-dependent homocysteine/selenocysteine methylase
MPRHRHALPQLDDRLFLTDGGIETTLIFHDGVELPDFAAFDLLRRPGGEDVLRKYFRSYAEIARQFGAGLILESATWRASADWGARLGYDAPALAEANRRAIGLLEEIRREVESDATRVVISGCIGPRGDGYDPGLMMTAPDAEAYHRQQIDTFADTEADMITAITMNYAGEAIGVARAAREAGMPVALAFTVETDGKLPTGQTLPEAMAQVEDATSGYPAYYMINCAHPTHFEHVLVGRDAWLERIRGLRANASAKSHAELNESPELDPGDPPELAAQHARLKQQLPRLNVLGGCCGTDHRHIALIAEACAPLFPAGATRHA